MRALLSQRAAATIDTLRVRGWETAFLTSDPQVSLVLWRDELEDPLAAQDVVMDVGTGASESSGDTGLVTTERDVEFRRPVSYGFDVEIGDTFTVQDMRGTIVRVVEYQGMIRASARLDLGSV